MHAKKVQLCCILSGKAGFLMTRQKGANLLHFKWKSRFSRDAPKRCKFFAFLSGKAGFLVTRQNPEI